MKNGQSREIQMVKQSGGGVGIDILGSEAY